MIGERKRSYHNEPTTNYLPPQALNEILQILNFF